jgi:hypothetical protein
MIELFSEDARRSRVVLERLEGSEWIPSMRTRTGLLALYRAQGWASYRIRDDIGVIVTVIDGQPVEAEA